MIQKVVNSREPSLRKISKKVEKIDKKILSLIQDLKDTLEAQKDPEGVGLAAPQIGKNFRIFAINHKDVKKIFINPEVLEIKNLSGVKKPKSDDILEGCLSLPNYYGPVKRPGYVKIEYMDEYGKIQTEEFVNLFAQIILHEVDHLNGILFVDKLLESGKQLYKVENGKWEEVELI